MATWQCGHVKRIDAIWVTGAIGGESGAASCKEKELASNGSATGKWAATGIFSR
jgi:hypothetical protein